MNGIRAMFATIGLSRMRPRLVRRVLSTTLLVFVLSIAGSRVESQDRDDIASAEPTRVRSLEPRSASNASHSDAPPAAKGKRRASASTVGFATYYARSFHGRMTASGVRFDTHAMVAGHPTYPFGTVVRVTNLQNGRSAKVRIVDRGPARGLRRSGVIVDVSRAVAQRLGFIPAGRARVRLDVLSWG
jgi:rare lipoprotein A